MKARALVIVGLLVSAFALLAFLYRTTAQADSEWHGELTAELRQLMRLDAELNQITLQTRYGFLDHYDGLVDALDRIAAVEARIETELAPASPAARERMTAELALLRQALTRKSRLIEQFKSENAILGNSIRYFPLAVDQALASPRVRADDELRRQVEDLIVDATRLALHGDADSALAVTRSAERLEDRFADGERTEVGRFVHQVEHLVQHAAQTDGLIEEILAQPTIERLESLESLAHAAHAVTLYRTQRQRSLLLTLALALLIYGAYAFYGQQQARWALRDANEQLEERIAERTAELTNRNQQLQHEIAERQRAEEELVQKNRELDEFTYVASHDLQEPVRKLISFSGMLEQDLGTDLPPRAEEDLHYIVDAARRMSRLVQDLLALSRAGKQAMRPEPIDLDDCLDEALLALQVRIEETDAEILRTDLPKACIDRTMLTQLFQNLVGNALKFCPAGERPVVCVEAEEVDGEHLLSVRDNGIGLKAEYAEQIFAPFKRLHGRGEYEGTGIGLSICEKTVSRHGGRIWVESEVGQGASFRFTLPAAAAVAEEPVAELEPVG